MKKPDKSVKKRIADQNRGKKRSDRLKSTQANKTDRQKSVKKQKEEAQKKFQTYLDSLMPK